MKEQPEQRAANAALENHVQKYHPDALGILSLGGGLALVVTRQAKTEGLIICKCVEHDYICEDLHGMTVCYEKCIRWDCNVVRPEFNEALIAAYR